jgi:hypothetical protein
MHSMNRSASYWRTVTCYDENSDVFSAEPNLDQFGSASFQFNSVSLQSETDSFHKKAVDYIYPRGSDAGRLSPLFCFLSVVSVGYHPFRLLITNLN